MIGISSRQLSFCLLLASSVSKTGAAQPTTAVVRIRVVDSAGAPVAMADVAATRGLNSVVSSGTTDASGLASLSVPRGSDDYHVVARRIGYQRGDHFFRPERDTVPLLIRLRRTPTSLPAVEVTAQEDLKTKRYRIGAEDIAASTRPIHDGLDVVTKLRPDMMYPPGQGIFTRCGLYYLWINGKRIIFPPIDPGLAAKNRNQRRAARATPHLGVTGQASVPVSVQSALSKIRPEHIEEMNYVDCRDNTLDFARSQGAVFVALKPGVAYDYVRGTYVTDLAALETAEDLFAPAMALDTTARPAPASYRVRILGVFDEATGQPIVGAEVIDVASGTFALTTATGTVSLAYLPEGASAVRVRKPGYTDLKLDVSISPRDTLPITLVLAKP